jgi:hypothetical protein
MTGKILILDRKHSTLEIQDEDDAYSYSYIGGVSHIRKDETRYGTENRIYDIFSGYCSAGFVTNVKEIKEVW